MRNDAEVVAIQEEDDFNSVRELDADEIDVVSGGYTPGQFNATMAMIRMGFPYTVWQQ